MLEDKVDGIVGIGPKYLKILHENNIWSKKDLILFTPSRYIHYELVDVNDIKEDTLITIKGVVDSNLASIGLKSSKAILFFVNTSNVRIKVVGFGMEYLRYKLKKGASYAFFGTYKYLTKELYLKNVFSQDFKEFIEPVYPIKIANSYMMKFISEIYKERPKLEEEIPLEYLNKRNLFDINEYLYQAHFPSNISSTYEVIKRQKYEKYLKYNISLKALRYYYDSNKKSPKSFDYNKILSVIRNLEYKLTDDQFKALNDILNDFKSPYLENRLIQGDVGCGKTIVASLALYANYLAGYQGGLMVPSEVLSNQHFTKIKELLSPYGLRIELINSGISLSNRKKIYKDIENGEIDIIIGTQSLIQSGVMFNKLGFVVIDEQHRFGVRERQELINKGIKCDAVFMSATPIPRTLGITKFADLDISTIESVPSNRKKVLTKVCDINDLDFIANAINKNVIKNHQVFVVVPVINESVLEGIVNIDDAYKMLSERLPNVRFRILHGGIKSQEKAQIMDDFKNHKFDCLISTTVIEVGIDIKNATLMVIYNAERYGLATLHQLRGRVGRNDLVCGCILATQNKLCDRLRIMEETYDCFKLAEEDLLLRGPGDILGDSQSGFVGINIMNDLDIFKESASDAEEIYNDYVNGIKRPIIEKIIELGKENNKLN